VLVQSSVSPERLGDMHEAIFSPEGNFFSEVVRNSETPLKNAAE
jgi:hypothetical protein